MSKGKVRFTTETFKQAVIEKYGEDRYDLSLVEYKGMHEKVTLICHKVDEFNGAEHGKFEIRASHLLDGYGCPKCSERRRYTVEEWKQICTQVHNGFYGYGEATFKSIHDKAKIWCPVHGWFWQHAYLHMSGSRCDKCARGMKPMGYVEPPKVRKRINVKPYGYWNDYERCKEEAKSYVNRKDLQTKCYGLYVAIKRNGWTDILDEVDSRREIRYVDFAKSVHCVYIYLLEDFNACYIGRTKCLQRRHRQHKYGVKHSDSRYEFDNLYKFCQGHGIEMPEPLLLVDHLTADESLELEDRYVKQYRKDGWNVINKAATGVGKGSLGAAIKWTYEACAEEAKKYQTRTQFQSGNQSAYKASVRNGWIIEFFNNKKKLRGYWSKIENCRVEVEKYKSVKELSVNCASAYNSIRKHGWKHLFEYYETCERSNPNDSIIDWSYEDCKSEAAKYKNKEAFKLGNVNVWRVARENGWLDEFFKDSRTRKPDNYWDDIENVKKAALECCNISELAQKYYAAYMKVRKHGWKDLLTFKPRED